MDTTLIQATLESVSAVLQETAQRQKAFELQQEKASAEFEARQQKSAAEFEARQQKSAAEFEARQKEYEARREKEAAEAEVRLKKIEELVFGNAKAAKKTAARDAKAEEEYKKQMKSYAEINRILDKLAEETGGISHNNGFFAEEYFYNALDATRKLGNIQFDFIERNRRRHTGKMQGEFDIMMFNGTSIAIIETKYRAHQNSLEQLTTKKVQNFRALYPEYAGYKIYLGIASMSFNDEVINEAKRLGIGVLKQKGDTIECETDNIRAY